MNCQDVKFPFEFHSLHPEEAVLLKESYGVPIEFLRVGPKGYLFPVGYKDDAASLYNLSLKKDDVILNSFPRSGTTWTQELVWLIVKELDYESARSTPLALRYTFIEFPFIFNERAVDKIVEICKSNGKDVDVEYLKQFSKPGAEVLANSLSPRFIKTHLPLSLLPPSTIDTAKVVYVARDPRDAAVSFWHLHKAAIYVDYKGDFKSYWNLFRNNLIFWTPYFEHLKEAWAVRHHPNMLFLFYEELSTDLPGTIRRVADFLGKHLSEEQIVGLSKHLSFEIFKKNDAVNNNALENLGALKEIGTFIRKGKAGGWREHFDEEMAAEAERWIADNLRDIDLRFPHFHC